VNAGAYENELIVAGFIGWLNVAVTMVPVTLLLLLLVLVDTLVVLLLGLDETTVGLAAEAAEVPTTKVVSSSATYPISDLKNIFKLFIFSS